MARLIEKILIMGLPGAGKTTLAKRVAPMLNAVLFDGDEVRKLWPELGFSHRDRVENAARIGRICDWVNDCGVTTVASFICPTVETRLAFGATVTIWCDRIKEGRFADTNVMFSSPLHYDLRLASGTMDDWALRVSAMLQLKREAA